MQGFFYLGGNECHMISLDLHKIPNDKAIAIVMIIAISILGPFWFIFQYNDSWIAKYNLITLLLISGASGFPIIVIHCATLYLFSNTFFDPKQWPRVAIVASLFAMNPYYLPGLFKHTGKLMTPDKALNIAIKIGVCNLICLLLLGVSFSIALYHSSKKPKITILSSNTPVAPADPLPPNHLPETPSGT